jgi:phosphoribosylanthranilate isomerase
MSDRMPRVKICCISSVQEAHLAIRYGASAIGLVSEMPSGPGVVSEDTIAEIVSHIPPGIETFLLTSKLTAEAVIAQQRKTQVSTIQFVDAFPVADYAVLRRSLPEIRLVQVVHVMGDKSIQDACAVAPHVDAVLLDSGNPFLKTKELGGTGRTHDWSVSRRICERVQIPVYLAGGLTPDNVKEAINQVHPYALDVCSGVRTNGRLDEHKLETFFLRMNE